MPLVIACSRRSFGGSLLLATAGLALSERNRVAAVAFHPDMCAEIVVASPAP